MDITEKNKINIIQNVCHIHGSVNDKIAIGSGALEDVKESQVDIEYPTIDKF